METSIAVALAIGLTLTMACGDAGKSNSQTPPASQSQSAPAAGQSPAGKTEHVFRGKVEQVDAAGKLMSVNGENVEGWMPAMTMSYTADNAEVFNQVKVGDQITATV